MIARFAQALENFPRNSRRRIFLVYGTALIVGTHIPRFTIKSQGMVIPPDRILHLLAFAGLTALIIGTHLINSTAPTMFNKKNIYTSATLAFLWGALTELTQQFLVPGRHANQWDILSNTLGITLTLIICLILGVAQSKHAS